MPPFIECLMLPVSCALCAPVFWSGNDWCAWHLPAINYPPSRLSTWGTGTIHPCVQTRKTRTSRVKQQAKWQTHNWWGSAFSLLISELLCYWPHDKMTRSRKTKYHGWEKSDSTVGCPVPDLSGNDSLKERRLHSPVPGQEGDVALGQVQCNVGSVVCAMPQAPGRAEDTCKAGSVKHSYNVQRMAPGCLLGYQGQHSARDTDGTVCLLARSPVWIFLRQGLWGAGMRMLRGIEGPAGFLGLLPRLSCSGQEAPRLHSEAQSSLENRTENSKVQPSGHTERQRTVWQELPGSEYTQRTPNSNCGRRNGKDCWKLAVMWASILHKNALLCQRRSGLLGWGDLFNKENKQITRRPKITWM